MTLSIIAPEFNARNFTAVTYIDAKGEERPMYDMTRDGFVLLAMGFTGAKAARFKEDYINEFNLMEEELRKRAQQSTPTDYAAAIRTTPRIASRSQGRASSLSLAKCCNNRQ